MNYLYSNDFNEPMGNSSGVPESNMERLRYSEKQLFKAAEEAYEIVRAYEIGLGSFRESWADTPHWSKRSAIEMVKYIAANPDLDDAELHDHWVYYKISTGWVLGDVYSLDLASHPCLVPYTDLAPELMTKITLFRLTVKRVLEIP